MPRNAMAQVAIKPLLYRGTITCGARTRRGTPCQAKKLLRGGRCKLHGGASTGATLAGGASPGPGQPRASARRSTARRAR